MNGRTYNTRHKIRHRTQRHPPRANIRRVDLTRVDEAGGVDEEAVEEDEEHDGEDGDFLAGYTGVGDGDVLGEHGDFDDEGE